MSEELQKELDRLKAENTKLARDLSGLTDELKETRHEARDRRHEAKGLAEQLAALTTERDELKVKAEADPEGLRKSLEGAQGVIRGLKHDGAFARVAKGLKVNDPAKFTDLVKLAGYQPDGDEPDEVKIGAAFVEALKARPWLVDEPAKPAAGAAQNASGGANVAQSGKPGVTPGPGADRGQSLQSDGKSKAPDRIAGRL